MSAVRRSLTAVIEYPEAGSLTDCDLWSMIDQIMPVAECATQPEHVMVAKVIDARRGWVIDHPDQATSGPPGALLLDLVPLYLPPGVGPWWATHDGPDLVPMSLGYRRHPDGTMTLLSLAHTPIPATKEPAA